MIQTGVPFHDHGPTALPGIQLSLSSDMMNCVIGWCRFIFQKSEQLSRPLHRHSVWELHYVSEGSLLFSFEDEEILLLPDHFLMIPAGVPHSITCSREDTAKLVLGFHVESSVPVLGAFFHETASPCLSAASPVLRQMLTALFLKFQSENLASSLSLRYMLHALISEAAELCLSAGPPALPRSGNSRRQEILSFIQNNILRPLTATEVAAHMGFEVRQANRICQKELGCSIHSLIVRLRLESLQALLSQTEFSLSNIAEMTGFSSVYAFSRHFKAAAGMTPGQYRRQFSSCHPSKGEYR